VSETRKVCVLLHGIRDKRLDTAVSQVMVTPALRDTFESALNFIARFADEMRSLDTSGRAQQMRNVSEVNVKRAGRGTGRGTTHSGRGAGRTGGRTGLNNRRKIEVEDRCYPYEEWKLLDEDQLNGDRFIQLLESNILYDYRTLEAVSAKRKGTVTAADLSKRWHIGLQAAQRTIQQTTQRGVRDFTSTGGFRRMKHTAHQLMYRHIRATIYTDTMFSNVKSLKQHTCAQAYVTNFHFTKVYPMRSKSEAHQTLDELHHDVGVFHTIVPDNAKELTEGEFCKKAIHAGSQIRPIEAHRHNQNLAESGIRELRRMYRKAMRTTNAPHVLWDRCIYLMAEIRSHTALDIPELKGDTP
jgi:hypothetical protein